MKYEDKRQLCTPYFYDLTIENQKQAFNELLQKAPHIEVIDEIEGQLKELVKLRHPKRQLPLNEAKTEIDKQLNGKPAHQHGTWVYYPWLKKVVHLLGEQEFVEVRTNRNQYKITPTEEETLAKKTVGVIGLSVGKSIALTMATERVCGHLILADFDTLELSNLNRIQTGVQNLGLKKTVVAAREIAEIDPYLKVTCFHEGLTHANLNDFFLLEGKLDMCVEVCDGLEMKIRAREKAREHRIPVVMNSSDRGTTDVERYDLHPELPLLHGLIDHLSLEELANAKTNEEKVPYLLPMLGLDTCTDRLKASMLEIQESITTWPQLASGVNLGGSICTDVCRRILLNQFEESGRYFIDLEESIGNAKSDNHHPAIATKQQEHGNDASPLDFDATYSKITEINALEEHTKEWLKPSEEEIKEMVTHAAMAPSGGNMQPWQWHYKGGMLLLYYDSKEHASSLNYKNLVSSLGQGAALENLHLKATQLGYAAVIEPFPTPLDIDIIAAIRFRKKEPRDALFAELVHSISYRTTDRTRIQGSPLPASVQQYLIESVESVDGFSLKLITQPDKLKRLARIIADVDILFMKNPSYHHNFMAELRWNTSELQKRKDGIDVETLELSATEKAGMQVARKWEVSAWLKKWGLGGALGKVSREAIENASGFGIITAPKSRAPNYLEAGRAMQRVWLAATHLKVAFQPMSVCSFLFKRLDDMALLGMEDIEEHLLLHRDEFRSICSTTTKESEIFLFRLTAKNQAYDRPLVRKELRKILTYGK